MTVMLLSRNIPAFGSEKFSNFSFSTDRLDELLSTYMKTNPYQKSFKSSTTHFSPVTWSTFGGKRFLSELKELEVENLANQSLVAQCLV